MKISTIMRISSIALAVAIVAAVLVVPVAHAGPCAGFDVGYTNVEWTSCPMGAFEASANAAQNHPVL
jgi:hypothetical protein